MNAEYITKTPEATIELGKKLAGCLNPGDTVLLYGDLGAGKTHFTKGIAEGLGIESTIKSPTYVYVNRYPVEGHVEGQVEGQIDGQFASQSAFREAAPQWLYHYDLYRFREGDDLSSIGFDETLEDSNAINVVEWADRLGDNLPDRYVLVAFNVNPDEHIVQIQFVDSAVVPEPQIEAYYDEWVTPLHVCAHAKKVTDVAMQVAQAFVDVGEIVKMDQIYTACMLHDMNRVCDFKELNRDRFEEEVTDEKWNRWVELREQYKGMHHADISAKILNERGFYETAELIRLHKSVNIVREPNAYDSLEKQIVYYADKRVKHDEIVDLAERFRDGRARYEQFDSIDNRELFDEVEEKTQQLEKELFSSLKIEPGDV